MNVSKHILALGFAVAIASPAMAADDLMPPPADGPFSITGSAALTSEYFFRGFSQSNDSPSVSAGLNLNYKINDSITATAGVWSASVDSGTANGDVELDAILGLAGTIGDFGWTAGSTWYTYPGSNNTNGTVATANEPDFWEGSLGASYNWGPFTTAVMYAYSPDFNLNSGTGHYINGKVTVPVKYVDLSAAIGRQYIEKNTTWGGPDYTDYRLAAAAKFYGLDFELAYVDTSVTPAQQRANANFADSQFIFTVTKNF